MGGKLGGSHKTEMEVEVVGMNCTFSGGTEGTTKLYISQHLHVYVYKHE